MISPVTHLQHPFIFSILRVEGTLLKRSEFECEAGSQLLNTNFLLILEDVPVQNTINIFTFLKQKIQFYLTLALFAHRYIKKSLLLKYATVKKFTCGIWKRWSLAGCERWRPVDPQTGGSVERERRTAGQWSDPDGLRNCSGSPLDSVRLALYLTSAQNKETGIKPW